MFFGERALVTLACNKITSGVLNQPVRACSAIIAGSLYLIPYLTTFNYLKVSVLTLDIMLVASITQQSAQSAGGHNLLIIFLEDGFIS